jgi:hypothetical protein
MSTVQSAAWQTEFGISQKRSAHFFTSKDDFTATNAAVPQAHVLRRAFDLLALDAVLCSDNAPLVYFKQVSKIESEESLRLYRDFWNHGGAPLFVLIDPWNVHIYSGLRRPTESVDAQGHAAGFVDQMERATIALQEFLPSVESGDFFRRHAKSFDPKQRVDRDLLDNLQATREKLVDALERDVDPDVLDALLCRLVFTCYLFDRGVIDAEYLSGAGIPNAEHLRDVLSIKPRYLAKDYLYNKLFKTLGADFNGDLFSDDLVVESGLVAATHLDLLEAFFRGTQVKGGQQSFWPYNFGVIPIETISAIYERFLKPSDKDKGAFYTPRFLAEIVLDSLLLRTTELIGKRYLDPACGSGVFLVGVFNRIAEEWTQANPDAKNDRRAKELLKLLQDSVFGIDINLTACRITAFSLYLAYLDQLSPRGIRELQDKKGALPRLVGCPVGSKSTKGGKNIWCGDFFLADERYPTDVDFVVGNPPWGSIAVEGTPAAIWCDSQKPAVAIPDKQIAAAFMRKAPLHAGKTGQLCLVLPHGILFNLNTIEFQRVLFSQYAVDRVLNLADYQRFLFEEAGHPAVVIVYRPTAPLSKGHAIDYWAPKVDWSVMRAEIITIAPEDRSTFTVRDVLEDMEGVNAPQIWKRRFWATPRDWRLIDRLSAYPPLHEHVRRAREKNTKKPWVMAVGFQPVTEGDDPAKAETIQLPSNHFITASSPNLDLFLLEDEVSRLPAPEVTVRNRSNKSTEVFNGPHVLVAKGFTSTAFVDFSCSFQDAVRGISGPVEDRDLLVFLMAYLRSGLARYFLFHTSSSWGVNRQEVHVEEMLRLPFPLPASQTDANACRKIIKEVSEIVTAAALRAAEQWSDRTEIVRLTDAAIEPLVDRYFDVLSIEKVLIDDTVNVIIPSVRPTQRRPIVPTIVESDAKLLGLYTKRLCETLDRWARRSGFAVKGSHTSSSKLGIGVTVLQRSERSAKAAPPEVPPDLLATLDRLRQLTSRKLNTFELARGVKAFDGDRLYVVKPIGQRNWTGTAALNDADEIAGIILMHVPEGVA